MQVKIAKIEIHPFSIAFSHALEFLQGPVTQRSGWIVQITGEDGSTGLGEIAPLPGFSDETTEIAKRALKETASSFQHATLRMDVGLPVFSLVASVNCGMELAIYQLAAASSGRSLGSFFGFYHHESIPVNALIAAPDEHIQQELDRIRQAGYSTVKLKVGGMTPERAADRVLMVRGLMDPSISLRLDANRSWSLQEAIEFGRLISDCEIEFLEEPLADPLELPVFIQKSGLPIALDESLLDCDLEWMASLPRVAAIILKPMLLGGFSAGTRFVRWARKHSIPCVVSSSLESGVGTLGNIALASAIGAHPVAAGLDPYNRIVMDTLNPAIQMGSRVDAPDELLQKRTLNQETLNKPT